MGEPIKPTLIFLAGPTGSGKADLLNKTVKYLGIEEKSVSDRVDIQFGSIDHLIENNVEYKQLCYRVFHKYTVLDEDKNRSDDGEISFKGKISLNDYNKFLRIGNESSKVTLNFQDGKVENDEILLTDYVSAIYYALKKKEGCIVEENETGEKDRSIKMAEISKDGKKNCNAKYDELVFKKINKGETFAIETNATNGYGNILDWYEDLQKKTNFYKLGYNVVFSFVFVEFCENIKRIEKRLKLTITKFLTDYEKNANINYEKVKDIASYLDDIDNAYNPQTSPETRLPSAPRLPETDLGVFGEKFDLTLNTLKEIKKCTAYNINDKKCRSDYALKDRKNRWFLNRPNIAERLLLFDNNPSKDGKKEGDDDPNTPIYDSNETRKETINLKTGVSQFDEILSGKREIYQKKKTCDKSAAGGRPKRRKTNRKKIKIKKINASHRRGKR